MLKSSDNEKMESSKTNSRSGLSAPLLGMGWSTRITKSRTKGAKDERESSGCHGGGHGWKEALSGLLPSRTNTWEDAARPCLKNAQEGLRPPGKSKSQPDRQSAKVQGMLNELKDNTGLRYSAGRSGDVAFTGR